MRLLLINPILPELFSRSHILPFGYLSLDAWLTEHGHQVDLLFPEQHLWREPQILDYVARTKPEIIGMGGFYDWLNVAARLSHLIRKRFPEIPQIFGGVMATPNPELCFRIAPLDFVCRGEGEIALQKLLDDLDRGGAGEGIPGICRLRDGAFVDGGYGEPVDLDALPEFNWEKVNVSQYLFNWQLKSPLLPYRFPIGFFMTGRGCPYHCNFCFSIQKYRQLSLDRIFERLDRFVERYRPSYMMFMDDTLCASPHWTREFCRRLVAKAYGFQYYCTGRVNVFDDEMAAALKESGCSSVHLALENADDGILQRMDKRITAAQFLECVSVAKRHGLIPNVSAMCGQPGESRETIEKTVTTLLNLIDEKNPWATISYFLLRIFPGSPLYEEGKAKGLFRDDLEFYGRHFSPRPVWMCSVPHVTAQAIVGKVNGLITNLSHLHMTGTRKGRPIHFKLDIGSPAPVNA